MRLWMVFLALVTACQFEVAAAVRGDGGDIDVPPDAPQLCFGSYVKVCFDAFENVPTVEAPLPAGAMISIDTATSTMCDQHNDRKGELCVIVGKGITLMTPQTLRAFGAKPLVLLSTTTIDMSGTLDVSSNHMAGADNTGAGANPASMCAVATAATGNSGGAGASFHGAGGNGFAQDGTAGGASTGTNTFPPGLRGGCPGGPGSTMNAGIGGVPGGGGNGGGAVALVAVMDLHLDGTIRAFGAGGLGGKGNESGGGGGGSGGMVVLEAGTVTATSGALVFANGGGGGQGGAPPGSMMADRGKDGSESPAPTTAALGGTDGSKAGGSGGNGAAGLLLFGSPGLQGAPGGGGGAGGGGAGFVHAPGVDPANVSPADLPLPL